MFDDSTLAQFRQRLLGLREELQVLDSTSRDAAETVELDQTRQGRLSRMDALQGQPISQALYERLGDFFDFGHMAPEIVIL